MDATLDNDLQFILFITPAIVRMQKDLQYNAQGLHEECQYLFQPQLIVQRLIGISVLYPGYFIDQMIPLHNRSVLYKVFIPNYISRVKVQLVDCNTKNRSGESCPVLLKIRSRAPPVHNSSAVDCRENMPCELDVPLPSWEQWYYILVERYLSSSDVYFRIGVHVKEVSLLIRLPPHFSRMSCGAAEPLLEPMMPGDVGADGLVRGDEEKDH
ncbi:putative transmembrane protein 8B [Triplophysa rosa]|uniref:Transmembrane protein 8B n=1 Tax=Triplophysa rosa TaxID=992332 RepID=A0A9W7X1S9_TRIRA|nr:putative transmembrane protein 8B [Triplophysa rosa]